MNSGALRTRTTHHKTLFAAACLLLMSSLSVTGTASAAGAYLPPMDRAAFEQAFTRAFSATDLAATLPLFYWQGMDAQSKQVVYSLIRNDLGKTPRRMTWLPAEGDAGQQHEHRQRYRSNLPVVARLLVEFTDANGLFSVSVHDMGISGGVYFIVLFEPVPLTA